MRRAILTVAAAALMTVGGSTTALADSVTECAKMQGKALVQLYGSYFKEATRACGKGAAGDPLAISQAAIAKAVGNLYKGVGKAVDKIGPGSCLFNLETISDPGVGGSPDSILNTAKQLADQACLVP